MTSIDLKFTMNISKKNIFLLLFFLLHYCANAQRVNLDYGLISYYPFTEDATDKTGQNHGAVHNAKLENSRCGDNAYYFNGGDAYIDCGNHKSLNANFSALTIAAWIRPSEIINNKLGTIVAKWGFHEQRDQFGIWISPTYKIVAAISAPGTMEEGVFSAATLQPDAWYHFVVTWKRNGEIRIYINGKPDKLGRQNGRGINTRSDLSLKIGRQVVRKNRAYKGYIDELRFYSRALNDNEVSALYNKDRVQCEKIIIKGTVYNKKDRVPTPAEVIVEDMNTGAIVSVTKTDDKAAYEINIPKGGKFAFYAKKENFLSENKNIDTDKYEINTTINTDLFLVPVEKGETLTLNNIFFEFNKATLQKESHAELNRILPFFQQYPTLKIEIAGHTDNVGSEEYNQKLSEERANSVKDYLLSQGIPAQNIVGRGYGELEPVTSNDTEEGRQENRRVEFRILDI